MDEREYIRQVMSNATQQLSEDIEDAATTGRSHHTVMPSVTMVSELMTLLRRLLFPGYFDAEYIISEARFHHVGVDLERVFIIARKQIACALVFAGRHDDETRCVEARGIAIKFIDTLPAIRELLLTDVAAIMAGDPAVTDKGEVIFSYPSITVMLHYRVAHSLHQLGVPILPRIITEMAHSITGVDIHPAATIGRYFAIDHGTGIVVGATSIIGDHVMLYQGVTLGARNFEYDETGHPMDVPRHPIIEDRVVVYSNTSILGRITIGHDSIIGGNVWLTHDVPAHSRIIQGKPIQQQMFSDGAGI